MVNLSLNTKLGINYKSSSQKIRVISEAWTKKEIYCPSCYSKLKEFHNNQPVADFYCPFCNEEFELKSKKGNIGKKVSDGAYKAKISRLQDLNNPNLFILNYDSYSFEVLNFIIVPKHFFIPEIIEKRKPLSDKARRKGWVGSNIIIDKIPLSGKIFYIKNRIIENKALVSD